jgi:signal transduction histidine kinase/ActR/RegA family two-component response regulator
MIRSMSPEVADGLARAANAVLGTAVLAIAASVAAAMRRRSTHSVEPLGVAFVIVFLAIGVHAWVHVVAIGERGEPGVSYVLIVVEWIAAVSAIAFVALHRRHGLFVGSADIARDYERKEQEARALAQVNEELRRLDQLKSEFLAMVSHELRTPLTAIIGYSRLLLRQAHGTLNAKQVEHQEAIFRSAQRLSELINELLDVSRLEAGRVELAPRPTSLRHIADQAIAVVGVAAQAKQIRLENAVSADLPLVNADPTRLQQILVNLIGNGVKFTPTGGRVALSAGAQRDQVWVAVEDTGVGISAQELARIWDPFYQVESPLSRRHGGSGLGLSIVRRLVELHGGVVRAESGGINRGSRFTLTLPVAVAVQDAPVEPEPPLQPVLTGRHVLIVEDEHENQTVLRSIVEEVLGGKATVCNDGEQALRATMEQAPALVLLDLMLPGLSGWEVARRLRQNPRTRETAIIAVSALARTQEREAALHAGCDAYLAKPFTPEEMGRLIATALARHGAAA